jgi:hypothetical protein
MQGFHFNNLILTDEGEISIDNLTKDHKIISLNNSDNIENCSIDDIASFQSDCIEVEFENGFSLICTFFANIFDADKQNFVKAHSLVKGARAQTTKDILVVKKIKYLYDQKMINIKFQNLPSYYINSILCHSHEVVSSYAIYKKSSLNQNIFAIDDICRIIDPNTERYNNIDISWKSEKFNKWRKAFYLLDNDFSKNSSGYSFGEKNTLEIKISTQSTSSKKIIFYGTGSGAYCEISSNCSVKLYETDGVFMFLMEDFDAESIIFKFKNTTHAVLTNCVFVSSYELAQFNRIFQG